MWFTPSNAADFSDHTYMVAKVSQYDYNSKRLWDFIQNQTWASVEFDIDSMGESAFVKNTSYNFTELLDKLGEVIEKDESKVLPVFINYSGDVHFLDSIINNSSIARRIFYLPQGETWPSLEYLVQSNRRIIFYLQGEIEKESRILHHINDYALQISATRITPNSIILNTESNINKELFKINSFHRLPTGLSPSQVNRNLVPDYINFLLESWTKYGKKPNFITVGNSIYNFDFIVGQLNSFDAVKGLVRTSGKNLERVFWKNPDILVTGGKFSFPVRGGEEVILSPFAPGFSMTPSQLIVTAEMEVPEQYSIMANPMNLSEGIMASFNFESQIKDIVNPSRVFQGRGFSFSQDIDRGSVLRLPENATVLLGDPDLYGLPNSSFTVSCFVKFTDILEFGDNAILGNDEQGYRRGLHLILRSGHPYFGLWANDFMSNEVLKNNTWYHLTWRYIIETGQQAIFVNGQFVGGSDGHPPYSGTSDIHIGSALSGGASLRGYIDNLHIWNRPLGNEEITRLSSDEEIQLLDEKEDGPLLTSSKLILILVASLLVFMALAVWMFIARNKNKKQSILYQAPKVPENNTIQLFGEFKAINKEHSPLSDHFTPKVKELFIYTLVHSLKNDSGAPISEIDSTLWHGIDSKKTANNRAVTLNKLRKILVQFDQIEILSNNGYLQLKTSGGFFCDYLEAYKLCNIAEGMNREQLEVFFHFVKKGSLLKGVAWDWLDEIRGFMGNQVIDNLLKLASIYKKENKYKEVEKVAQRILDYDDLNEEGMYLQIWALQQANNTNLAKYNFKAFCARYEKTMGEEFALKFNEFTKSYSEQF